MKLEIYYYYYYYYRAAAMSGQYSEAAKILEVRTIIYVHFYVLEPTYIDSLYCNFYDFENVIKNQVT